MCNTINPDYRQHDNSFNFNVNFYCPNEMCSGKLREHKRTFQSLGRSDYQFFNSGPCVRCPKTFLTNKYVRFSWSVTKDLWFWGDTLQDNFDDVFCPDKFCSWQKCGFVPILKQNGESCYKSQRCSTCCLVCISLQRTRNQQLWCFMLMGFIALPVRGVLTTKMKNRLAGWGKVSANHNQ